MLIKCAAKYCNEQTTNASFFFRFPSSSFATRRSIWVKNTQADISPTDNECYLCPKHFGPDQFRNRSLRWDAVPRLYQPQDESDAEDVQEQPVIREIKARKPRKRKSEEYSYELDHSGDALRAYIVKQFSSTQYHQKPRLNLNYFDTPEKPRDKPQPEPNNEQPQPKPVQEKPPPPPPAKPALSSTTTTSSDGGIVDFEEEIDRLNDPLHSEKPVAKRRDEDVRTRFTDEDDIPLEKLILGTKKSNTFNTSLPLLPRLSVAVPPLSDNPASDDSCNGDTVDDPEPECILGDPLPSSYSEPSEKIVPDALPNNFDTTAVNDDNANDSSLKGSSSTAECFSLCSKCDYYASSEDNLRDHEKQMHKSTRSPTSKVYPFKILTKSDGSQYYLCDYCNFNGKAMSNLVEHMVEHFPKETKKGLSIQKYCATIAVSGKTVKDVVTVNLNGNENSDSEVVEILDDDEEEDVLADDSLSNVVIESVKGGVEVNKLFPKSKRKTPTRRSTRRKRS